MDIEQDGTAAPDPAEPPRVEPGLALNGRRSGPFVGAALATVLGCIFLLPLFDDWWLKAAVFCVCLLPVVIAGWITRRAVRREASRRAGER
ncbi:ABC transporter ATP-binding protein [Pseudoclavibacter sp. AY1F1]|uniref:ABC transporter ATP-binding protein n=1 Tax=Pseudoclavibacter sp. AY1F1 TaxID=2080583 RepID=UPI0011B08A05|nr:ABC transporter ATP-binding protein [Pseudoclavibacter sp. AY1F1]